MRTIFLLRCSVEHCCARLPLPEPAAIHPEPKQLRTRSRPHRHRRAAADSNFATRHNRRRRTASASSAGVANPRTPRIAPGSVIPVQLTKTIDAKKAKPGDQIVAKVTMDLKTTSGEVLVPKDTKVMGHVTEAQARNKEQKESQVGIEFDRAVLKSGDMNMPMSIQAVIAPPSNNANAGSDQGAPAPTGARPRLPQRAVARSGPWEVPVKVHRRRLHPARTLKAWKGRRSSSRAEPGRPSPATRRAWWESRI